MICNYMLMLQIHLFVNTNKNICWQYVNLGSTFIPLYLRFTQYKKKWKHIVWDVKKKYDEQKF